MRLSLMNIACALVSSMIMASPTQAQTVLKFSQFLPADQFFQVDVVEPFAREVEERTKGKVKFEFFDAATPLGKVTEQAENVETGKVDIALGLRGAEGDRFLRSSIIELPFVVRDAGSGSMNLWKLYTSGALGDEYSKFKVLALFVHNPGQVHMKSTRIETVDQLKGMRLRSPNDTVSAALTQLGAVPAVLQYNEIGPAFDKGELDGVITAWGNPIPGFNNYVTQHTDIPFYASAFFILMNKERYESLPEDVRAVLDEMTGETWVSKFGDYWDKWDKPNFDEALARNEEIVKPSPEALEGWRDALAPVADAYLSGLETRGINDAREIYEKLRQ